MNYLKRGLALVLLITNFAIVSQNQKKNNNDINSAYLEVIKKEDSEEKVDKLIDLFITSIKNRPIQYNIAESAIKSAIDIGYQKGLGRAYFRKGVALRYQQKYDEAIRYHKQALSYLDENKYPKYRMRCLNSLGSAYRKMNFEKEAISCYYKVLQLERIDNNTKTRTIALNGMGNIFLETKQYKKAIIYFEDALKIDLSTQYLKGAEYEYANIGEAYIYLNDFDKARVAINKSIELAKQNKRPHKIGPPLSLLGLICQKQGNYKKSCEYYDKAVELFKKDNNFRYLSGALINLGTNYMYLGDTQKGLNLISQGISYAKKVRSRENILLGNNKLIDFYNKKGDYKKAFTTQQNFIKVKDSILNSSSINSIIKYEATYQTEEKELKIQKLVKEKQFQQEEKEKAEKKLILTLVIGAILTLLIISLFYLYYKNSELKIENMRSQLKERIQDLENLERIENKQNGKSFEERMTAYDLSKREIEVLELMLEGKKNQEISDTLYITINTVKTHIRKIYAKLDTKNRTELISKIEK